MSRHITYPRPPAGWKSQSWQETMAMAEEVLSQFAESTRHLPGKHDQKSHAGGRGGGDDARLAGIVAGCYEGGATLNPLDGYNAPTTGICVARRHSGRTVDGVTNGRIVDEAEFFADNGRRGAGILADYVDERVDTFFTERGEGDFGPPMVGVWHNTGEGLVALDVVDVVPSSQKDSALKLGREQNQISVFDLDTFEEIPTGGSGRARQAEGDTHRAAPEGAVGGDDPGGEDRVHAPRGQVGEADQVRHLPGKHDQKSHGRKGGGGGIGIGGEEMSAGLAAGAKNRAPNPIDGPDGTQFRSLPEQVRLDMELAVLDKYGVGIGGMKANILDAVDTATPGEVAYGERWYQDALVVSDRFATEYGVSLEQSVGVIAAMSPRTGWDANVAWAEHALRVRRDNPIIGDDVLGATVTKNKQTRSAASWLAEGGVTVKSGTRFSDLDIDTQSAVVRVMGQVDGRKIRVQRYTSEGTPTGRWVGTAPPFGLSVANALRIADGKPGDLDGISVALGGHKVRSFYNDIVTGGGSTSITIDAHALDAAIVGADAVRHGTKAPDAGTWISEGFGSVADGTNGSYAVFHEAFRQATVAYNEGHGTDLSAPQVQAIAWLTTLRGSEASKAGR